VDSSPGLQDWLLVDGDVDAARGDIDTERSVRISGSVVGPLSLEMMADIEVGGRIEAGAHIEAQGGIVVGGGIVGSATQVRALGDVRAGRIAEAEVLARGGIEVEGHISRARVRAGSQLHVGAGGIVGGEVSAVTDLKVAGDVGVDSLLAIAPDPDTSARLAKVREGLDFCENDIGRILRTLGLKTVARAEIQVAFQRAPAHKRKFFIGILKQLNQLVKLREQLLGKRREHEERRAKKLRAASITVSGTVFAGTRIGIGEAELVLEKGLPGVQFYLEADAQIGYAALGVDEKTTTVEH